MSSLPGRTWKALSRSLSAPPEKSFKRSEQTILASGKLRYVGELVAVCVAKTRAEAEDIAQLIGLEFEELPAVVDMIEACKPNAPLVHEEWDSNKIVEFVKDGAIEEVAKRAAVKVQKHIRTSRHCMFPMEGRGVIAYEDARLRYLTVISSTQFPHCVQTGLCEALGISDGDVRVISPDVGGGSRLQGRAELRRSCSGMARAAFEVSGALARGLSRTSGREFELPRARLRHYLLRLGGR